MAEKMLNVKCDFCGKEIECPEDMLNSEKHACYECFWEHPEKLDGVSAEKLHVDFPTDKAEQVLPAMIATGAVETTFPELWATRKEELKEMSKKELAEEMFAEGAATVAALMIKMGKEGKLKKY